jgi:hypothetical protein
MEYLIAYGDLCLNHRPLSKARITAKKRETHRLSDFFGQQILMLMFPFL